jgi:hypothetical protein
MELDKMEKEEADMAMERELVQLQDENVSLKASKLVASMRDFGNLLNSPTSSGTYTLTLAPYCFFCV